MRAVILAAGWGKRLLPLTRDRSKAMMPVVGKPLIARVVEQLLQSGVHEFIFITKPDDEEIRLYFSQWPGSDIAVEFVEQAEPLGTAHALTLAAPHVGQSFLLSACDNLTSAEHISHLFRVQGSKQAHATLSLMRIGSSQRPGASVELRNGEVVRLIEKPQPGERLSNITSLPLYVLSPQLFDYLPLVSLSVRDEYEVQDAMQLLIRRRGKVRGVFTPHRMQVTTVEDLLTANRRHLACVDPCRPPRRVDPRTGKV